VVDGPIWAYDCSDLVDSKALRNEAIITSEGNTVMQQTLSLQPSNSPTACPSSSPSLEPTRDPSPSPTASPSNSPSMSPTTTPNGKVVGVVFEGVNGNGIQDAAEPGISGVDVVITDSSAGVRMW
jgi:hypothetical protein